MKDPISPRVGQNLELKQAQETMAREFHQGRQRLIYGVHRVGTTSIKVVPP